MFNKKKKKIESVAVAAVRKEFSSERIDEWLERTGIELVRRQARLSEQIMIWVNWLKMSDEEKRVSDEKSRELFGVDNRSHHRMIMASFCQ